MIRAIRHVGLVVIDLNQALEIWCEVLGFRIQKRLEESGAQIDGMMGLEGVKVTTIKLMAGDGTLLELLKFHSHPSDEKWGGRACSIGITHFALTVDNIDKICEQLSKYKVKFPGPPQYSADGKVRVVYASLPEGTLVELVEEQV